MNKRMEWYVVNTRPHQENVVARNLMRYGVETFSPQIRNERVIRRIRRTVVSPLFSGYLFAKFNLNTHCRAVSYAHGVRRLVAFGQVPAVVDEEIIDSIKSRAPNGYVQIHSPVFKSGQTVRIQAGPLQGLEAIFEQEMNDHQRSLLLLQTLSYQARVVVSLEHVVGC